MFIYKNWKIITLFYNIKYKSIKLNTVYFENIERYCQECEKNNYDYIVITPTRRCIRSISGIEIKKEGVSQIPDITLKRMVEGSTKKYVKNDWSNYI